MREPLGIPTVRDRVVQTAVLLILAPIFEADFQDCSHGYRLGRIAHNALEQIDRNCALATVRSTTQISKPTSTLFRTTS